LADRSRAVLPARARSQCNAQHLPARNAGRARKTERTSQADGTYASLELLREIELGEDCRELAEHPDNAWLLFSLEFGF